MFLANTILRPNVVEMLADHKTNIGSMYCVCWAITVLTAIKYNRADLRMPTCPVFSYLPCLQLTYARQTATTNRMLCI